MTPSRGGECPKARGLHKLNCTAKSSLSVARTNQTPGPHGQLSGETHPLLCRENGGLGGTACPSQPHTHGLRCVPNSFHLFASRSSYCRSLISAHLLCSPPSHGCLEATGHWLPGLPSLPSLAVSEALSPPHWLGAPPHD